MSNASLSSSVHTKGLVYRRVSSAALYALVLLLCPPQVSAEVVATIYQQELKGDLTIVAPTDVYIDGLLWPMAEILDIKVSPEAQGEEREQQEARVQKVRAMAPLSRNSHLAFGSDVRRRLMEGNFTQLETFYEELRGKQTVNGSFYSAWFFEAIHNLVENEGNVAAELIPRWLEAEPNSVAARVADIKMRSEWAARARGNAYNSSTAPEKLRDFERQSEEISELLTELEKQNHNEPQVYSALMINPITRGETTADILQKVRRAAAVDPYYWPVYTLASTYTLRRYGGNRDDLHALLELIDKVAPAEYRDEYYFRVARKIFEWGAVEYAYADFDSERIKQGFEDVRNRHLVNNEVVSVSLAMAYVARDSVYFETLRKHLTSMGNGGVNLYESWGGINNAVNLQDAYSFTSLHEQPSEYYDALHAIVSDDLDALAKALVSKRTKYETDHLSNTLLHAAVSENNIPALRMLIKAGAKLEAQNVYDQTALFSAARGGKTDAATILIEGGADITTTDSTNQTPLHYAARQRRPYLLSTLLSKKSVPINAQSTNGDTALHIAVLNNNVTAVSLLTQHTDIDLNLTRGKGRSALHLAVYPPKPEILELLVRAGCLLYTSDAADE